MKCPTCNKTLEQISSKTFACKHCKMKGDQALWKTLIQKEKDYQLLAKKNIYKVRVCENCHDMMELLHNTREELKKAFNKTLGHIVD